MGEKKRYAGCCLGSDRESIRSMAEGSRRISWRAFSRQVDLGELHGIYPFTYYARHWRQGLMLRNDPCASFHKGEYRGRPCVYVSHSAIEYIFA